MVAVEAPASVRQMTERQFQSLIVEAATLLGFRCYHTQFSLKSAPGFPDLVCAKPGRLVAIEVKSERGTVSPAQLEWVDLLGSVPGVTAMVARPSDWDAVVQALQGEG